MSRNVVALVALVFVSGCSDSFSRGLYMASLVSNGEDGATAMRDTRLQFQPHIDRPFFFGSLANECERSNFTPDQRAVYRQALRASMIYTANEPVEEVKTGISNAEEHISSHMDSDYATRQLQPVMDALDCVASKLPE